MFEAVSEAYSMGKAAVGHVAESAQLLGHGVANPGDVLDAMTEIGIEGSSHAVGGATFETGLLMAPFAKGAPVAAVAQEARHGVNLLAPKALATAETAAGKAAAMRAAERVAARTAAAESSQAAGAAAEATADAGSVGRLTYQHQLKAGKTTDVPGLSGQIGQEVDTMNQVIKMESIQGLQQRILAYRADPSIEAAGRAHVKTLGPAGCTSCGDPLAWLHRLDMSKGGSPTDIAGRGLLRNNSIIGGQANRIADEILKMPTGTTRIEWELVLKQVRVKTSK